MKEYVIGVDVGGTSFKWGVVNQKGEVLEKDSFKVDHSLTQEQIFRQLIDRIGILVNRPEYKDKIEGIGLGIPGAIDGVNGVCKASFNLRMDNCEIVKPFEETLHIKTKVANDADSATLGEAIFGSGSSYNSVVLLTLGTGVGSGVVINKKLYLGNGSMGMEMGHMVIKASDSRKCTCGRTGCFEAYASATGLITTTKEEIAKYPDSILADEKDLNGKVIFDAYKKGDKAACAALDRYVADLGEGCLNVCNIYRPEAILLSGGIAEAGEDFLDRVRDYLKKGHYGFACYPEVKVAKATLGYNSGIIGAACLILQDK